MATFDVYLATSRSHEAVMLHAWDPAGDVRDVPGVRVGPDAYRFSLDMSAPDLTAVSLKLWYPGEIPEWEKDDYVRRVPTAGVRALWTAEYSARCLTTDPAAARPLAAGTVVNVKAVTAGRFAGGELYAWDPASGQSARFPETARDPARKLSSFEVKLEPWMTSGFHFKLARGDGFEPEAANRFWRPIDGRRVFVKSGQIDLHATAPATVNVPISVVVPAALAAQAAVGVADAVDDFRDDATRTGTVKLDDDFVAVEFATALYPDAPYRVTPRIDPGDGHPGYQPPWSLPLRAPAAGAPARWHTLLGVSEWYASPPARDATVELRIHANPGSRLGATVEVPWRLGFARRTRDETPSPVCGKAVATQGPGGWTGTLKLFGGVPHSFETLASGGAVETRADGPTLSQREVRPEGASRTVVHTLDGQTGLSRTPPDASPFLDLGAAERRRLLKAAFSPAIVEAGVFAPHELPHGATWHDGALWFVLPAPHATRASLLLLRRTRSRSPRQVQTVPMKLTADLRYWWCRVPREELPDAARVEYRFSLDDGTEVLDPASRRATDTPYVWPERGEGAEGAWSVAVDRAKLAAEALSPGWQTPFWNEFMIYELHARRFTERNARRGTPVPPLEQVERELGRYLASLPVTALELLPLNEFPKYISWGYDTSLYFAVESSYGGPSAFAALVKASHAAGKAVVLDVVFNHLTDSPMQATAKDVFVDGQTQWGDMVNYDHPACLEFFRQALVYFYDTFQVDGVRFDATEAIVNGHVQNGAIIRDGRVGSGGGWDFLRALHVALDTAAVATGRRLPYAIAENNPDNWGMDGAVVDGQWNFEFQGKVGWAARRDGDAAPALADVLMTRRRVEEAVNFEESHDSCSAQTEAERRVAARGPWGTGMRMAKACGALSLLARGVPMFFMGAEAGETRPFTFDAQSAAPLPLDAYEQADTENGKVLAWYRALLGLRKNWSNGFGSDDTPFIGKGNRTVAFTRDGGRFFVVVTLGTSDRRQDLGWLGLPQGSAYKEIFNSTWPDYQVDHDDPASNGGYDARLTAGTIANLPEIGAVVLERVG